jgi:predicted aldo/keto reductase-like oxidoreductase
VIQLHNRIGVQRAPKAPFGTGAVLALEDVLGPGGVVEVFQELRARGLVRFFGCTAFGGDMDVVKQVIDSDTFDVLTVHYSVLNETAWTLAQQRSDRDYACAGARAFSRNMGTVALRVLEGGALTSSGEGAAMREAASRVASECSRWGLGLTEGSIRCALSNPQVSTVLIGFSNLQQIDHAVVYSNRGPLTPVVQAGLRSWLRYEPSSTQPVV